MKAYIQIMLSICLIVAVIITIIGCPRKTRKHDPTSPEDVNQSIYGPEVHDNDLANATWTVIGDITPYSSGSLPDFEHEDTVVTLGNDSDDSILSTVETGNGWTFVYYGTNDRLSSIFAITSLGDEITLFFNEQNLLTEISHSGGISIIFDWETFTMTEMRGNTKSRSRIAATYGSTSPPQGSNIDTDEAACMQHRQDRFLRKQEIIENALADLSGYLRSWMRELVEEAFDYQMDLLLGKCENIPQPRCFGASGSGCWTIKLGGKANPLFPVERIGERHFRGFVSPGSILHDTCCQDHYKDSEQCKGGEEFPLCAEEWDMAWRDAGWGRWDFLREFGWYEEFGAYALNKGDELGQKGQRPDSPYRQEYEFTRKLSAPDGTVLASGDHAFCSSGNFQETYDNVAEQGYGTCGEPQVPPVSITCPGQAEGQNNITSPKTDVYNVDLLQSSGTFRFTYQTYTIKDQIIIVYDGEEIFDTGCAGTSGIRDFTYSGNSSSITVIVHSLCANESASTDWNFDVSCP